MKVSSLLKISGCLLVEIREGESKAFKIIAVIDYSMHTTEADGFYYPCSVCLDDEISNRKVDFFTSSKCTTHDGKCEACIEIYVK
jgi:hypothetical protein